MDPDDELFGRLLALDHSRQEPWGPVLDGPPARFAVTIRDVAVDGTFPADGYADRVRDWVAATLTAWHAGHADQRK